MKCSWKSWQMVRLRHSMWRTVLCLFVASVLGALMLVPPTQVLAQSGPICYGVTDGNGNSSGVDTLVSLDVVNGNATTIGETGTFNIEAIAFSADGQTLYAADQATLGSLDLATGGFTTIGPIGGGNGTAGELDFADVDGLTFDITTNTLFGSVRRGGEPTDLLIKIDSATGAAIPDAFGAGVDYLEIPTLDIGEVDLDDIAADPYTGILYAAANSGGSGGQLITIDKITGAVVDLGALGSSDIEALGAARDGSFATLYGSTGTNGPIPEDNNELYLIDKTNGASTLVDGLPETETLRDYESLDCIYQSGNIGDTIWSDDDQDGNGVVDGDDVVLEGVVVNLLDAAGNVVATDTTDVSGNYLFSDLEFGTYTVQIDTTTLPPIKQGNPVYDPDGGDDNMSTTTISVDEPNDFDQDFAYHKELGTIGDTIFHDANSDGVFDPAAGDFPLPGITVTLADDAGNVLDTAVTDPNGMYLFEELPLNETYTVIVDTTGLPADKMTDPTADPDGGDDSTSQVTLTDAAPEDLDQDFGYEPMPDPLGSIGDTIYHDANGNGAFDAADGDFPLEGVTVTLQDDAGNVLGTETTDANGLYLFDELPLDATYTVVVDPAGLPADKVTEPSADPDGGADNTSMVTLTEAAPDDLDQDFGYEPILGAIGDTIFHDANGDGMMDPADGDFPLEGVTVTLQDAAGNVVDTATTDANGNYLFDELPVDETYTVIVDPAGLPADKMTDPSADPDGGADNTSMVTLTPDAPEDLDQDFGYEPVLGSIGDTIFHDANSDGMMDPADGDFPLESVTVTLSDAAGTVVGTTATDADGMYLFEDLPVDETYTVMVDTGSLPANKETAPTADPDGGEDSMSEVTLTVAVPDDLDQDFGYEPMTGSIGDTIFHDANGDGMMDPADGDFPLEGVTVTLTDAAGNVVDTAMTDANGTYLFSDVPLDEPYTVMVDTSTLPEDKIAMPSADPDGGDDNMSVVTLTSDAPSNLDQDFGYEPLLGSIGDQIWHDDDQDGNGVIDGDDEPIEGVVVQLLDENGDIVATDTTDAMGQYLFEDIPVGATYTVQVDPLTLPVAKQGNPAYDPDGGDDDQSTVMLTAAMPDNLDQDFAYFAPDEPTGSIGDQIWHDDDQDGNNMLDGDDEPIEGVMVELLDSDGNVNATTTTDANGNYLFTEVPFGTYTVQVDTNSLPVAKQDNPAYDPDGGDDSMSTVTIDEAMPDSLDQDFAYFAPNEPTGSIGDQLWHDDDMDSNNMIDGDDEPLVGVVVNLVDGAGNVIATDTTDNNGNYLFEEVPYGTYTVQIDTTTLPVAKQGNPAFDPDGGDDNQSTVTIDATTPDDLNQDFAYAAPLPTGSIGDQVWHDDDQDGNGVLDGDDEPISGVVVNLLDNNGTLIATTTTDANGEYLFAGVPYGTYTVQIDPTTLPADKQGNPAYDPDGADDNQSTVTINDATPNSREQDFAYFAPPPVGTAAISLQKTVYAGNDGGASCPGGEIESGSDTPITYCFEVTNIGDVSLGDVQLTDADLNITRADMTLLSGTEPLAPGASMMFYYETTLVADLTNTATTSANPVDDDGNDMPGMEDPTDSDIAQVRIAASLGDYVWRDKNANGIQEADEEGIEGIVVYLLDADRNVLDTTTTDAGGFYLFDNLVPGDYAIRVELPQAGLEFSPQDQLDDSFDSDVDPQTGVSIVTTLDASESDRTLDAGIVAAPNLNVEKSANLEEVQPGAIVVFTLSYFNSGIGPSTGIRLTEVVPSNTTFEPDGSSEGWICENGAVTAGTVCTIEVGDLDAGERSTDDVFFVVRVDSGLDTAVIELANQVLISDDGLNGPSASGQTIDTSTVVIKHPTSLATDFEPGNIGEQTRRVFLPSVARTRLGQSGEAVSLTIDQIVMSWVCSFMDNFGWTSEACFISVE